jgi:hypothetical protein
MLKTLLSGQEAGMYKTSPRKASRGAGQGGRVLEPGLVHSEASPGQGRRRGGHDPRRWRRWRVGSGLRRARPGGCRGVASWRPETVPRPGRRPPAGQRVAPRGVRAAPMAAISRASAAKMAHPWRRRTSTRAPRRPPASGTAMAARTTTATRNTTPPAGRHDRAGLTGAAKPDDTSRPSGTYRSFPASSPSGAAPTLHRRLP